jgi:hypothetical protein
MTYIAVISRRGGGEDALKHVERVAMSGSSAWTAPSVGGTTHSIA